MKTKVNITRIEVIESNFYFTWVYIHYDIIGKNGKVVKSEKSWKQYALGGMEDEEGDYSKEQWNEIVEDYYNEDDNFGLETMCRSSLGDNWGYDEADIYSFMEDNDIDEILNIEF